MLKLTSYSGKGKSNSPVSSRREKKTEGANAERVELASEFFSQEKRKTRERRSRAS